MAKRSIKKKKRQVSKKDRPKCPRCGKNEAHFVPPCFGDRGMFACENFGGKPTPEWKAYRAEQQKEDRLELLFRGRRTE